MQDKLCQQANNYDNMRLIYDNVEHDYVDMQFKSYVNIPVIISHIDIIM